MPIRALAEQLDAVIRVARRDELVSLLALLADRVAIVRGKLVDPPSVAPLERVLTVPRAARWLRVHEDTVRALCKAGKIRHVLVGEREVRIPESAVTEFLRNGHGKASSRHDP